MTQIEPSGTIRIIDFHRFIPFPSHQPQYLSSKLPTENQTMESTLEQLIKQNRSLPLAPSVIGAFANPTAGSSLSDPLNTQRYIQYLTMPLTHQMNPDFAALCPSVHPVQTRASPTLMQRRKLNENQRFVLFTKILFRLLEQSSPQLVRQVKALVAHCSRRNRMGIPTMPHSKMQWRVVCAT